jgi:hypothetical protein
MARTHEVRFFILNSIGIFLTVFAFIVSPTTAKNSMYWMILSMGLFWAIDRILHALGGIPGETERDGVIWLIPIALGWIPLIMIGFEFIPGKYRLLSAVSTYCVASYFFVTLSRTELKELKPCYEEKSGVDAIKNIFGLLTYEMTVYDPNTQSNQRSMRAPSYSYAFYNICFGFTAFVISTKEILSDTGYIFTFVAILFAGMTFIMDKTINTDQKYLLWEMQDKEKLILCGLFGISTFNICMVLIISLIK